MKVFMFIQISQFGTLDNIFIDIVSIKKDSNFGSAFKVYNFILVFKLSIYIILINFEILILKV